MDKILSKNIQIDGLNIRYLTGGHGKPLIIVHGGSDGAEPWLANIAELAKNYTLYVPDLPGFGLSQSFEGDYYIPEFVNFINEFAKKLGLDSFYLMGHSLGGAIAAHYALKFPEKTRKLVLINSLCLGKEIALWIRLLSNPPMCKALGTAAHAVINGAKWLAELFVGPVEWQNPVTQTSIMIGSCITTIKEQTLVLLDELSSIMAPTLVIWGSKDPIVPAKHAYDAARLIPDCRVKVYAGAGHSLYRENIPEFSKLLRGFLE